MDAVNIRDYAFNKHQKVDDYPYGGGAGMLMQAEPVYLAYAVHRRKNRLQTTCGLSDPAGTGLYIRRWRKSFAKEKDLVFLCGHYEGIDERVLEEIVTDYVSIGDYVLTGGELPAMVMMDSISRMVPGSSEQSGIRRDGIFCRKSSRISTVQPSGRMARAKRFLRSFYPDIMPISKHGGESSPSCARRKTDRIFSERQTSPTRNGVRSASGENNGKPQKMRHQNE